jgi:Raf kinase inhibitor-like YbhB/YbcL family protein
MQLTSTAFAEGAAIPSKYTCDAKNVSPPLKWSAAPAGAKSLALIADDPDAPVGTWVHWVLYDLPATATELPEDLPKSQFVAGGRSRASTTSNTWATEAPARRTAKRTGIVSSCTPWTSCSI